MSELETEGGREERELELGINVFAGVHVCINACFCIVYVLYVVSACLCVCRVVCLCVSGRVGTSNYRSTTNGDPLL